MIRIAHVTTVDMSLRYLLLNQLQSLGDEGYEVTGISSTGPHVQTLIEAGIHHVDIRLTRNFTPLADLRALWHLIQVFRREKFTIVHTHTPKPGLLGQAAAKFAGVPIVINTLHGFYFHENMPKARRMFYVTIEKLAARFSDLILSQNEEDIQTALEENICGIDKIRLLGNGIDIRRFDRHRIDEQGITRLQRELGLDANRPVVGFVGRLVEEKGTRELMKAAKIVIESCPGTQFLFVGPVDTHKDDAITPETADEYGVSSICTFTGLRQDMPDLYALMDVFVLPSHREGFPRAPMEATSMGVPCVVTDIRGCRQVVEHGRNGFLVALGNVQALANAIVQILSDPTLRNDMSRAGREIAIQRFDEERVFSRVKEEYRRLLYEKNIQ